ncbi:putative DCC family thiol-disulfide oxidoreductase YuxK [Rhodoblastus sphagnicola]|nr:DCC1-like thiol-disulfide oxidoreductase family protein [Rhodoblastus sphagnicola]MBB4200996.1 putative DCC family thiol-disulfide oxidoreductase YuxK [Rhodoblastus sphagnicola]
MGDEAMRPNGPEHPPTSPRGSAPVWLYDGYCIFCSRWVLFVLRREKAPLIRFVAFQSDEGRLLAERHGIDPDDTDSFLFIDGGKALVKSDGVAAVCARLRRPWSFAAFMTVFPRSLRDWVYDRIARNRHLLAGKRDFCMAPPPEWRARVVAPESRP